jgi:hypothetical protein
VSEKAVDEGMEWDSWPSKVNLVEEATLTLRTPPQRAHWRPKSGKEACVVRSLAGEVSYCSEGLLAACWATRQVEGRYGYVGCWAARSVDAPNQSQRMKVKGRIRSGG